MYTYFHLILIWLIDIAISDVLKSLSVVIQDSSESDVLFTVLNIIQNSKSPTRLKYSRAV